MAFLSGVFIKTSPTFVLEFRYRDDCVRIACSHSAAANAVNCLLACLISFGEVIGVHKSSSSPFRDLLQLGENLLHLTGSVCVGSNPASRTSLAGALWRGRRTQMHPNARKWPFLGMSTGMSRRAWELDRSGTPAVRRASATLALESALLLGFALSRDERLSERWTVEMAYRGNIQGSNQSIDRRAKNAHFDLTVVPESRFWLISVVWCRVVRLCIFPI